MALPGPSTQKAHMSTQQPEALRLADAMDAVNKNNADSLLVQMAARSASAELRRLHAINAELVEALKESLSVVRSVHTGRDRRVVRDGCVLFMQTDEWCQWLEVELEPKFSGIVAKAEGREA